MEKFIFKKGDIVQISKEGFRRYANQVSNNPEMLGTILNLWDNEPGSTCQIKWDNGHVNTYIMQRDFIPATTEALVQPPIDPKLKITVLSIDGEIEINLSEIYSITNKGNYSIIKKNTEDSKLFEIIVYQKFYVLKDLIAIEGLNENFSKTINGSKVSFYNLTAEDIENLQITKPASKPLAKTKSTNTLPKAVLNGTPGTEWPDILDTISNESEDA